MLTCSCMSLVDLFVHLTTKEVVDGAPGLVPLVDELALGSFGEVNLDLLFGQ